MPRSHIKILAPAKVNLTLEITGRRPDGYHTLHSLVAFTDVADTITLSPAQNFSFEVTGPFAPDFSAEESCIGEGATNLAIRAAQGLSILLEKPLNCAIALDKHLPLGGGIGGGSADAASTIKALLEFWNIPALPAGGDNFLLSLGADVPMCFAGQPAHISGIGETITPLEAFPECPILLINPRIKIPTALIFRNFVHNPAKVQTQNFPPSFETCEDLYQYIENSRNDLTPAACALAPEICDVLAQLEERAGCHLARMSGSGSTCFGLFKTLDDAQAARQTLHARNPHWWTHAGRVGKRKENPKRDSRASALKSNSLLA